MTNEEYLKEINRLESRCSNLQAVVNGDAYNIKRLSEINERLVDACSISEMELETLQGEIEMTYRYYAGFGAKKDLTTTEMLNHILRTVPNYKPTTEEHDLEDMKRHCDHYIKALEEITKKNRKAETCRMIALKALGELDDDKYQPELLIEENLKLRMQVEDLESKIIKYSIDKVFPTVKIYEN
jgi:neutral trehalase